MEAGFRQGSYSAYVFCQVQNNLRVEVYGDDFVVLGPSKIILVPWSSAA